MKDKKFNIKRRVNRKCAGFSLAEMLVSVAIMLLFTIIMTSLMNTATLAYKKCVTSSNADVMVTEAVNLLRLELSDASDVTIVDKTTFDSEDMQSKYGTSGYELKTYDKNNVTKQFCVTYTDASTGAECMMFRATKDKNDNLYVSKYGKVSLLLNTTDDLQIIFSDIDVNEKTIIIRDLRAQKDGTQYSRLSSVTIKLK